MFSNRLGFLVPTILSLALALSAIEARAGFIGLQTFASDGGRGDTIGGNSFYNVYLSQDNGTSFLNTGDGSSTAIDLPTTTDGTFSYKFFYYNGFSQNLQLNLLFGDGLNSISVTTARDSNGLAFTSVNPGSDFITIGGTTITLTEFAFTNGTGPASSTSVTPNASISPQILGSFTYRVQGAAVPEPSSIVLVGLGAAGLLAIARRRSRRA